MAESIAEAMSVVADAAQELREVTNFLDDQEVDAALAAIANIVIKPHIPGNAAVPLILQLQAISAHCAIKYKYYYTIGKNGSDERYKKELYLTLRDALDRLVDALKYVIKS